MKKPINLLALLAVAVLLFSSCHGVKSCPAYGKVQKPATEKPA